MGHIAHQFRHLRHDIGAGNHGGTAPPVALRREGASEIEVDGRESGFGDCANQCGELKGVAEDNLRCETERRVEGRCDVAQVA